MQAWGLNSQFWAFFCRFCLSNLHAGQSITAVCLQLHLLLPRLQVVTSLIEAAAQLRHPQLPASDLEDLGDWPGQQHLEQHLRLMGCIADAGLGTADILTACQMLLKRCHYPAPMRPCVNAFAQARAAESGMAG